jgi:hypothetical protein
MEFPACQEKNVNDCIFLRYGVCDGNCRTNLVQYRRLFGENLILPKAAGHADGFRLPKTPKTGGYV